MNLRENLYQVLCQLAKEEKKSPVEYLGGFEKFCEYQKRVIDQATDKEIEFYCDLYDNLVSDASIFDSKKEKTYSISGFYFNSVMVSKDEDIVVVPQIVFY